MQQEIFQLDFLPNARLLLPVFFTHRNAQKLQFSQAHDIPKYFLLA